MRIFQCLKRMEIAHKFIVLLTKPEGVISILALIVYAKYNVIRR